MGKLSGLISSTYGFTVEAATALSHPPAGAQNAPQTSNYVYYSRSQNTLLYQQPNTPFSSQERRELPLPVIIPQRRPQNKSRGWARAYAPALMGAGIDETTFLDFLDRFNEESKASPYLHVVNVAGAGIGFLPGITPMIVSMAVPVAVQAAKKAQSNRQSDSYLDKMNKALFVPHGLYAIVMTYNPSQIGDTVNVDTSPNSTQFQASSPYSPNGNDQRQNQEFTLPESCPLLFADPAPPQRLNPSLNGFFKMADFVSDFKDRRAQASFAQRNPTSTLVGPRPTFTSKYADPGYASSGKQEKSPSSGQEDNEEKKKPGMLKGMKEKIMQSDVLYLMIANNPTDSASPSVPDPTQHVAKRSGSTYQYGSPPSRTHTLQTQEQYPVVYANNPNQQKCNNSIAYSRSQADTPQAQCPSTYQYGPPPLPPRISAPQFLYPQQLSTAAAEYSPRRKFGTPQNSDTEYDYEPEKEKMQVEQKERYYIAQQPPLPNERQYGAPVLDSTAPPVYTPHPKDKWDEWE
ncbi:hypothetical protein DL98DRAFT_604826 [Cadophora sp. DSE1049]|nr:hypothetical protein DL98DRAFT_604826 [Cadophora sp. DSE1049]